MTTKAIYLVRADKLQLGDRCLSPVRGHVDGVMVDISYVRVTWAHGVTTTFPRHVRFEVIEEG